MLAPAGGALGGRLRPPTPWLEEVDRGLVPAPGRLPASVEVAVVGGGVLGVCAAYWLARMGAGVLLLESRLPAWGASGRNAGLVLGGPASLDAMREVLDEEGIDAGWCEPGHLALASGGEVLESFRKELAARPASAPPIHLLDRAECEALLGTRIAERFAGGRWMPRAGALHPARFVYGLAAAAVRRGAAVSTRTPVRAVGRDGDGWRVATGRGEVRAGAVVLACNAAAGRLWPALAKVLAPSRGQVLATAPLPPLFAPAMAVDYGAVYWRQREDGTVILGGCRGADPEGERSGREALNPRIQEALERFIPLAFPDAPPVAVTRRWAGIMDSTPDGRPVVGACPGAPGMWVAAGLGGHGLPPALGTGRALARAIVEGSVPPEIAALDPGRFAPC